MIEITESQIERVHAILGRVPNGVNKAMYSTINRALTSLRSSSGKLVRATYNIKSSEIKSGQNMKMKRATLQDVEGSIAFAGTVIPLIKFGVKPTQPEKRRVSVSVLRSQGGKRLESAYVANLGRYGVGVFERATRRRESSQQLYGPSLAHMMENENVISKAEAAAQETINKRIEHEISRILNGYGA